MRQALRKSITLALDVDLTEESSLLHAVELKADKTKLSQVFRNLLSNAIKFSHQGSIVTLNAAVIKHACQTDARGNRRVNPVKSTLTVVVTDTGPGISQVSNLN